LNRRRFWKGDLTEDKRMAYETLFECLMVVNQLMSPVAPFFTDWMYRNLTDAVRDKAVAKQTPLRYSSVHLTDLTVPDDKFIDTALEQRMDYAQQISSLVLSIRKKEKIRVRQPLRRILLAVKDDNFVEQVDQIKALVL